MLIPNKLFIAFAFGLCMSFITPLTVHGQDTGEVKVYRTQFTELHGKVKTMLGRVEQQSRDGLGEGEKVNIRQELLALTTLIYRLGEEAGRSNLNIVKKGQNSNKTLLLIVIGCNALGGVLNSLDDFIDTDDRGFLGLAKEEDGFVKSVEKIL